MRCDEKMYFKCYSLNELFQISETLQREFLIIDIIFQRVIILARYIWIFHILPMLITLFFFFLQVLNMNTWN